MIFFSVVHKIRHLKKVGNQTVDGDIDKYEQKCNPDSKKRWGILLNAITIKNL